MSFWNLAVSYKFWISVRKICNCNDTVYKNFSLYFLLLLTDWLSPFNEVRKPTALLWKFYANIFTAHFCEFLTQKRDCHSGIGKIIFILIETNWNMQHAEKCRRFMRDKWQNSFSTITFSIEYFCYFILLVRKYLSDLCKPLVASWLIDSDETAACP